MYKYLIILLVFFSCKSKQEANLSIKDFIGTYNLSDDNVLDTLAIFKNNTYKHVQYSKSNDVLILIDTGSWFHSYKGYDFEKYSFNKNDTASGSINFQTYFGPYGIVCMDIDTDGQYKYVKIEE